MTRALLIANPAAARTDPLAVNAIMSTLKSAGWEAEVLATGGPGDARVLAAYGVSEGVDVVAVFGGDGTTMQAAAATCATAKSRNTLVHNYPPSIGPIDNAPSRSMVSYQTAAVPMVYPMTAAAQLTV